MNIQRCQAWLFAIGSICALPAYASDYTMSVPQLDVPIAPGAYADVPLTITNTTTSTSNGYDIRLAAPYPGPSYSYEIRSAADCGPLMPENVFPPVAMHTRIAPIAAGASTTCVIRVTRDAGEIDSGLVYWQATPITGAGFESLVLRFGTFADTDLAASVLSRTVSSDGIHEVLRVAVHNRSPMAVTPTVSIDPWFTARALRRVVAGSCALEIPNLGPFVGPGEFLTFTSIEPDATAQCDIEAMLALTEGVTSTSIRITTVSASATGGNVNPSLDPLDDVPFPLHFAEVGLNQYGLSGSWANAATPAQGVVLNIVADFYGEGHALLFGGWFTYDGSPGNVPRWYTLQANVAGTGERFELDAAANIYWSNGGVFGSSQATTTPSLGHAWLRFADCNHGQLVYEFDDNVRHGFIPITRLLPNATCTPDQGSGTAVGANYNLVGTWADPSDSAQGLVVDVDPASHVLFAGWFTYPRAYVPFAQRWYTLQGLLEPDAARGSGIAIYQSSGGEFNGPAPTVTVPVGDVDITMHDCMNATLTYRFNAGENAGLAGTLALQRLGNPPPGCSM